MGHTMVYSTSDRHQAALEEVGSGAGTSRRRAILVSGGKRLVVPPSGAVIGRSRECDIVLDDSNVSRRHAEIAPSGQSWLIRDLGSTNGVRVNGRTVEGPHPLESGDRVELGTVDVLFEVE
jgi:pSer/pThr/pTyr-binding forkhead associated (FHA) protein